MCVHVPARVCVSVFVRAHVLYVCVSVLYLAVDSGVNHITMPVPTHHLTAWQVGSTALIFASEYGHEAVCVLLVERGADANAKDDVSGQRDSFEWVCLCSGLLLLFHI